MSNEDTSLPAPSPPPRDDTSGYVSKANIGFSNDQGSIFPPRDDAATDDDDTNNCNVEISQIHSSTDHISSQPQPQSRSPPKIHLVIANIQKIANIRSMMKAAIAFGCHSVIVVGQHHNSKRPNFFPPQFQKARSSGQIQLHQFSKWKECVDYLKTVSMYLVGVEIDERSRILDDTYFDKYFPMNQSNVGLLMGNEGQGIIQQYLKECHQIIRIPQYGSGTASLNVNVACNIVLYKFQYWNNQMILQIRTENHTISKSDKEGVGTGME